MSDVVSASPKKSPCFSSPTVTSPSSVTFPVKVRVNLAFSPSVIAVTGSPTVSSEAETVTTGSACVLPLAVSETAPIPTELMAETR